MSANDVASFGQKSAFETQRAALLSEILISFDHVLTNLNHLNRALEGVAAVGREFESIEALWSKFDEVLSHETAVTAQGGESDSKVAEGAGEAGPSGNDTTPVRST